MTSGGGGGAIRIDDIEFPTQQQESISTILGSLKRATLSIHNRLSSILADAEFVRSAAQTLGPQRPLVANERCGSWYIRPCDKAASAYFKSTDGHERAWKFSSRRLNLHLVPLIEQHDGIIIVDSTRRGKRMPDALSTTIPIWCTVLNTVLLPEHPLSAQLFLPPHLLATTHAQITALMPQFVASLRALQLRDLPALSKPLRPYWVTQDSTLASQGHEIYESFRPVICLTASRRVTAASEVDSNGYIQGAADDTENWARGLAPPVFWANADLLLATPESELPDLIYTLTAQQQQQVDVDAATVVQLTSCLSVCALPLPLPLLQGAAGCCCVSLTTDSTPRDQWIKSTTAMEVGLGKHKTASRNLRTALPHLCDFVAGYLRENLQGRVTIACESGKDTSVGTALALSCYLFDDEGRFREPLDKTSFTKTLVKMRLGAIMTAYPGGNPSRQTLQSVNSFLMDWTK